MSKGVTYLTPKKPLTEIQEEREGRAIEQSIDLYEAIAGLSEELEAAREQLEQLTARITALEGGQK